MALYPGVFRRGNTHTLRIHVPKDIVQTYANGRREFWVALGTSDPSEANELAKIKKGEFALAFKAHRKGKGQ